MNPALKREHPARDKRPDDIIGADVGIFLELLQESDNPVGFDMVGPRIELPVGPRRRPRKVSRQIDEVFRSTVPDVEEGFLPSPDRLQTGEFEKGAPLARADNAGSALNRRFGIGNVLALDRVDPKAEEASKSFFCRTETYVGLHERNKTRKIKNGIARKVVRLKFVEVKEFAEEIRSRKAKTALKMGGEDHYFARFGRRLALLARNPAEYLFRYPPGPVKPINLGLIYVGALPGPAGEYRQAIHCCCAF